MKQSIGCAVCAVLFFAACGEGVCASQAAGGDFPRVWTSYQWGRRADRQFADLAAHGVDVVEAPCWDAAVTRDALRLCRKHNLKAFTYTDEMSESSKYALKGKPYELAVMIGGAYRGRAIDRNLFAFTAGPHDIVIEPPVYSRRQPYTRGKKKSGHYFGARVPVRAEVVVPLKLFDGQQHLKILPCEILPVEKGTPVENDTATPEMRGSDEIKNRRLVRLRFDLTPYSGALLDKVGLAVYWASDDKGASWAAGHAHMSVFAASTRDNARASVRHRLQNWIDGNGGTFPADVLVGMRFGDECFSVTGWLDCPAASYPLYGYSPSGLAAFRQFAPGLEPPRTWGYPEIYGEAAYGAFLYNFHKGCADLTRAAVDEAHRIAPTLKVFRNTTRGGVWSYGNDHDGSGQDLLARELDILHLDPYPVAARYNASSIPYDMGYFKSLSRRYRKPLLPWLQAHRYAPCGLGHPTPDQIVRMWRQHKPFAPDGIMWLGYGTSADCTFPGGNSNSWAKASEVHRDLHARGVPADGADGKVRLAVVRPYATRALVCEKDGGRVRNPADAILGRLVLLWSVDKALAYDVFEIPPFESPAETARRIEQLKAYEIVVSSAPYGTARVVGEGTTGRTLTSAEIDAAARKALEQISPKPQQ